MMEQIALAEEIGGQLTFEELSRRLDEDENRQPLPSAKPLQR